MSAAGTRRVMLIDAHASRAETLAAGLRVPGTAVQVVGTLAEAWCAFGKSHPEVIVFAVDRGGSAAWFVHRVREQWLGAAPRIYIVCDEETAADEAPLEPDAFLLTPVCQSALARIAGPPPAPARGDERAIRLRELVESSLVGSDLSTHLDAVAARTALAFHASECLIIGPEHGAQWTRTSRCMAAEIVAHASLALRVRTTVFIGGQGAEPLIEEPCYSVIGAPFGDAGGLDGGICLVSDASRLFSSDDVEDLSLLVRRLSRELAWMAAHERLLGEHDRLRDAGPDPLLGIPGRMAFEQAAVAHTEGAVRRGDSVVLVVLDVVALRDINDRHGYRAGDRVLAHLAAIVRQELRAHDLVGRIGGDELAILTSGISIEVAQHAVARVIDAVARNPLPVDEAEVAIRLRAGLTHVPSCEVTLDRALARAWQALGQAVPMSVGAAMPGAEPSTLRGMASDVHDVGVLQTIHPGATLGGMYRVLHEISRGAMGVVYRGEDLGLGRQIAIKVLRADLAADRSLSAKFRDEAAILAAVRHENLVQVHAFGTGGGEVYFVMELVEGAPLSRVARTSPLALDAVADIVDGVAAALGALHAAGIIHRDVKPANILLDRRRDRVVLVDVGVAGRCDVKRDAAGTPGFAAPEAFTTHADTPQSDVYGLAATTYALLTGVRPFGAGTEAEVIARQEAHQVRRPSLVREGLPEAVDVVLLGALDPRPQVRHRSPQDFARALRAAIARDAARRRVDRPTARIAALSRPRALPRGSGPHATAPPPDSCRGIWFRVAARVLLQRVAPLWLKGVGRKNPQLREVLRPDLPPLGWHPTALLVELLRAVVSEVDDIAEVTRAIGAATMKTSLEHFLGAPIGSLDCTSLLHAAESYWPRYLSSGRITVHDVSASAVEVSISPGNGEVLLCGVMGGAYARIASLGGASRVVGDHVECATRGALDCRFRVSWQREAATALVAG